MNQNLRGNKLVYYEMGEIFNQFSLCKFEHKDDVFMLQLTKNFDLNLLLADCYLYSQRYIGRYQPYYHSVYTH